jgi:hypothetical protein
MKGCPTPRLLAVIVAVVCVALLAGPALAQFQTGNIYGKVQAKDGSVLPGVTVVLTGVGAPQTNVTDSQGLFRFINLSPGAYSLKAELAGYGSAIRSGVRVNVGQSADLTITMNPSVSESITVTAEAPLLDARKAGTATNVARVELEKIPSSRDPWTVLQSVPSVMVDRINVGGSQSGQQSVYIAKGALGRDNSWNMDGVNITDMGATGSSPLYFDFDSFEEMQVTTGGSDPRIQTPGVQLNLVTKRGTNDFKGTGRYFYTPGSMQAAAGVPTEASFYLDKTNRINFVRDYGGEIGGPILRDRIWFWAARGDQKISVQAAQSPGQIGAFDNIVLRNKNLKLNGQILSNNSAVAYYTWGDKVRNARDISPTRPFETAYRQAGPTPVYKLEDTQIIGSSLYLTGMWSKVVGGFGLFANGGRGESAPSSWRDAASVWHDSYQTYETKRPQKQYRLDGSKFFDIGRMNHELKFGFGYRDTPVSSTTVWPGPAHGYWYFDTATPAICARENLPSNCAIARVTRDANLGYGEKYRDFYLGDTILLGNFTITGGLRLDRQTTENLAVAVTGNPILTDPLTLPTGGSLGSGTLTASLPTLNFPGDSQSMKWNTVSPRIGATYAVGADKRTLLRASYNRYASQLGSVVANANPLNLSSFYFYGVDANNDHAIQRGELMKIRGFAGIDPANPTAARGSVRVDYGMKVPHTDEIILGAERELLTDFSVGVNYTYRKSADLYTLRYEKTQGKGDYYTAADYVQSSIVAGGTFTLCSSALVNGVCPPANVITTFTTSTQPVWALNSALANPVFQVLTTRNNYSQKFSGFEVTATKRMSNRWMFRSNFSWNDYTQHCGDDSFANPTKTNGIGSTGASNFGNCAGGQVAPASAGSGAFGNDFINSKWNANITGVYVAPWDINLGANFNARQGYPAVLRDAVTGLKGGTSNVILDPVGAKRFDNVYELDLRLAKDFRIMNRLGLTVSGDLFNAPNKRTVLQRETLILSTTASGVKSSRAAGWRITELQSPRAWRLGLRVSY